MNQNHDPAEMHGAGTVVAASLVVTLAAAALVLALQTPATLVVVGAGVLAAPTGSALAGLPARRRDERRSRQVCVPATGVCVDV